MSAMLPTVGAGEAVALPVPSRFLRDHLLLPVLALLLALLWLRWGQGDVWLAKWIYAAEGGHWSLRHGLITEAVLHRLGRALSLLGWLGVSAMAVLAWRRPAWRNWRRPLLYLSLSVLASVLLVGALKRSLVTDCPWDLAEFGGTRPMLAVGESRPLEWPAEHCFPAAHASTGYAWLALYFVAFGSLRWRRRALLGALGLGLAFGLGQQLRGAHFLSHDLWSAAICWSVALACTPLLGARRPWRRSAA